MDWGIIISLLSIVVTIWLAYKTGTTSKEIESIKSELKVEEFKRTEYQQRLFSIYADLWKNIQNTKDIFLVFTQPLQSYPDLSQFNPDELLEFLNETELAQRYKNKILNSIDKNKEYQNIIFWYRLNKLQNFYNDLYSSFEINRIFFSKEMNESLDSLISIFHKALVDIETGGETKDLRMKDMGYKLIREAYNRIEKEAQKIIDNIEQQIQEDIRK